MGNFNFTTPICENNNCYNDEEKDIRFKLSESRKKQQAQITKDHGEKKYFTLYLNDFAEVENMEKINKLITNF